MELSAMQFKSFVWPHNPETYTIEYERDVALHKLPFGRYVMENLGMNRRVMRGEGAFVGENAYETFKALASVFYEESAGTLLHPVWQRAKAYFVSLYLVQEPRRDYVRYGFVFWETEEGDRETGQTVTKVSVTASGNAQGASSAGGGAGASAPVYHTVVKGETLWRIGKDYGLSVEEILALNLGMKNPNLIYPGERVRVS